MSANTSVDTQAVRDSVVRQLLKLGRATASDLHIRIMEVTNRKELVPILKAMVQDGTLAIIDELQMEDDRVYGLAIVSRGRKGIR